ncbi:MAG: hypothetical protein IKM88_07060 [Lachnospiraceae bacterium]|nr:hypothetical protein [Lachnospiraceae bacterium]
MFNKLYDLPDDFKDPRLPYAAAAAIDDRNGPILEAWVKGVFDDVLDIEAYGMSLLEQPKVQLTKEEAVFELFAGDMQAGVYDDDRLDEYVDEHLDEYMENLDEYLDEYTYAYLEANKLAFPEFDEKDL